MGHEEKLGHVSRVGSVLKRISLLKMELVLLGFLAVLSRVDGFPSICTGKYQYKMDNVAECAICRICSPEVLGSQRMVGAVVPECKAKSPEPLPTGPRNAYAWCRLPNSKLPACKTWEDPNGEVKCVMGEYQMFVVYRACWLQCKAGFHPDKNVKVQCGDDLQWNDTLPRCVANTDTSFQVARDSPGNEHTTLSNASSHPILTSVLGVLAIISSIAAVFVFVKYRRNILRRGRTQSKISDDPQECTVDINVTPSTARKSSCFTVPPGVPVSVEAQCSCRGQRHLVRHLMVVSLATPPRLFGHFLSRGSSSPLVRLPPASSSGGSQFAWIAQVQECGSKKKEAKEGSFSVVVADSQSERQSVSTVGEDRQHLLYDNEAAQNILGSEDMNDLNEDQCEDQEGLLGMQRLLEDKAMMELVCRHLDREQRRGVLSWHRLATSLLGFQQQDLRFLEYHLKGKLYEGPTSHVMRLLYQQGVSVGAFLQCCRQAGDTQGDSQHLVAHISAFLDRRPVPYDPQTPSGLACPHPPASSTLAFPELTRAVERR